MAIWAEWNHLNQVSNLVLSVEYVEFYLLNMKFHTVKEWLTMCRICIIWDNWHVNISEHRVIYSYIWRFSSAAN